jgi:hypothetical protein
MLRANRNGWHVTLNVFYDLMYGTPFAVSSEATREADVTTSAAPSTSTDMRPELHGRSSRQGQGSDSPSAVIGAAVSAPGTTKPRLTGRRGRSGQRVLYGLRSGFVIAFIFAFTGSMAGPAV